MTVPRHQRATLSVTETPDGAGYVLDGVPYGLPAPLPLGAAELAARHAAALDFRALVPGAREEDRARQAAALAGALARLAAGQPLDTAARAALQADHPHATGPVLIRTDGSADKQSGSLSLGYLLGDRPYGAVLRGALGHEGLAEREAIRVALTHARALGHTAFQVQSDHKFHVRRYDEALIHRGRRKSPSLERLDALVDELGPAVTFTYTPTLDTDAPHRLALHARALERLSRGLALSRAQAVALRRVHYALKAGGKGLY
ncbi:hypothetical protein [Deinococcus multiflagellatus]|uniref:RNase H type-1 domain-containing protein n=1 Tax=Deinococcus multiflagellatus TaxID=1656887 RepID=A0ABW1ZLR1_9DEIO|nr:hypothetical protein [Deinococcus multiflagellatus]MBZ9714857.1 hypothetical protein [Deinococcus multiflagellatus]